MFKTLNPKPSTGLDKPQVWMVCAVDCRVPAHYSDQVEMVGINVFAA